MNTDKKEAMNTTTVVMPPGSDAPKIRFGGQNMNNGDIRCLLLDVGGVLLTNGWDRGMRQEAARHFNLDEQEMSERHHLTFDTYESGKLSLDEYLHRVIFYRERDFSPDDFKAFMLGQSQPYQDMIDLVCSLAQKYSLRLGVISNEGRELTEYRIKQFSLHTFIHFFICSSFVHVRKPDAEIYRIALDIAQIAPQQCVYIEDRDMFVEVAAGLGIRGIVHRDFACTQKALADLGLRAPSAAYRGQEAA